MKKNLYVALIIISIFFGASQKISAQYNLNIQRCSDSLEVIALIDTVFLSGINPENISNITFHGDPFSVGYFIGGYIFGFDIPEGIVMSTGFSEHLDGNNTCSAANANGNTLGGSDPDLNALTNHNIHDACVIEFDFKAISDTASFVYIFGSEEYHDYVGSSFNDVLGFFLSGDGINGPYTNDAINIARVPGTNLAVSISNVNCGTQGVYCTPPSWGNNCEYLFDNTNPNLPTFNQTALDAYTTPFVADNETEPGQWYHIKLAIGDAGDSAFDSGIFLERGSFYLGTYTNVNESQSVENVNLFPVPAKDYIIIDFAEKIAGAYNVSIYNQVGQQVYAAQQVVNGENKSPKINVAELYTGIYFVKVITSTNQVYQSKFEIVR